MLYFYGLKVLRLNKQTPEEDKKILPNVVLQYMQ